MYNKTLRPDVRWLRDNNIIIIITLPVYIDTCEILLYREKTYTHIHYVHIIYYYFVVPLALCRFVGDPY